MKYFSMFSGIGGFERGIEQSGVDMECIGYSEIDKYARSIYEKHYPNHTWWGDATELNPKELPEFDLLVGGFPCQTFSIAGKRRGFDDSRGTLFFEIARVVKEKEPSYLLLENVKGLLSHDKGNTFKTMLGILSELGYDVEWEVLNSKDFGVPQNRERIFIKGYSRRKCGGEILSAKRGRREIIGEMIWGWTSTRVGKFVDPDGLGLTLCAEGHNSGHNQLVKQDIELTQINNNSPHSMAERIYDSDGLSTTLRDCGGGHGGKTGLYKVGNIEEKSEDKEIDLLNGTTDGNSYAIDANYYKGVSPSSIKKGKGTHLIEQSPKVVDIHVDESEIKRVWASNQSHGVRAGVKNSPCLTSAMGEGGGHVPMIEQDKPEFVRMHGSNQEHRMISEDTCCALNTHRTPMVEYVQKEGTGTISAKCDWGTVDKDYRIRRLTPKECERLQGFPDDWTKYGKDGELISDTQRYKCCGNAVTVNVIEYLIRSWFSNVGCDNYLED